MDDDFEHERERVKSGRPVKAIATTKLIQAGVIFQAICLEFGVTENEHARSSAFAQLKSRQAGILPPV